MSTYIIPYLNSGAEIIDPVITFPTLVSYDLSTKDCVVVAILETPNGSKFGVNLNVNMPTVNQGTADAKGQLKLDELYKQ